MKHYVTDERARNLRLLSAVGTYMQVVTYIPLSFLHAAAGPKKCTLNVFDRGENFGMCYVCMCMETL